MHRSDILFAGKYENLNKLCKFHGRGLMRFFKKVDLYLHNDSLPLTRHRPTMLIISYLLNTQKINNQLLTLPSLTRMQVLHYIST